MERTDYNAYLGSHFAMGVENEPIHLGEIDNFSQIQLFPEPTSEPATIIPTPGTCTLLFMACAAFFMRRRKSTAAPVSKPAQIIEVKNQMDRIPAQAEEEPEALNVA